MKSQKRTKLASGIVVAILLQCSVGYTVVHGATIIEAINQNDGTGSQPKIANVGINVTDTIGSNVDKAYIGVYSAGALAETTINLTGSQSVYLNSADKTSVAHAYGIYNAAGAQTNWQLTNSGESLISDVTGYKGSSYGIYNTGNNSQVEIKSDDGNGVSITANGHNSVDIESADADSTIPQYAPLMKTVAVWSDAGAKTTVDATDINARADGIYTLQRSTQQMYDQTVLTQLNDAIANAADAYAAVIDNYGTYTNQDAYMEDLRKAQASVDTAIANYETIAGGFYTVGIYGDTNATNTVTVSGSSGSIGVNNSFGVNSYIDGTQADGTVITKNIAMGIYGNNEAQNNVTVTGGITVNTSSNLNPQINGGSPNTDRKENSVHLMEAMGVVGDNFSTNKVTATSNIEVAGSMSSYANVDLLDQTSLSQTENNMLSAHFSGVYGTNGAINDIDVTGNNISATINNLTNYYYLQAQLDADYNLTSTNISTANVTGVEGSNTAKNYIFANTISATVQSFQPTNNLNFSKNYGTENIQSNAAINQGQTDTLKVRAVSSESGANNTIIASNITASIGNTSGSINDNLNTYENQNGITVDSNHKYTIDASIQGIYGNTAGTNQIKADMISAHVDYLQLGSSGYLSFWGNNENISTVNLLRNYAGIVNMQGVYGSNGAHNTVSTKDISVTAQNITASINDYTSNNNGNNDTTTVSSLLAYNNLINIQGVFGTNNAINEIDVAGDITTNISDFRSSINDSIYADTGNINDTITADVLTNIQGIYSSNAAINQIKATGTISAVLQNLELMLTSGINTTTSVAGSLDITGNAPINIQGVYANTKGINKVLASSISAQIQNIRAYNTLTNNSNDSSTTGSVSYYMPVVVQGVSGNNSATNVVNSTTIYADVGSGDNLSIAGSQESFSFLGKFPIEVTGVYANTQATNNITTDTIQATSGVYQQATTDDSNNILVMPASVNVFGIYGAGQSTTNLHSKEAGGTVNIAVGISDPSSSNLIDDSNLHTYGLYLDHSTVNFYNNVNVTGDALWNGGTAFDIPPITYLNNANINFQGYKTIFDSEYYDPYYYDATTNTYGKVIAGDDTFHTYTSSTGMLNLQGENTFTIHTDLVNNKSDMLSFATLSNESTGTNYISVGADASILKDTKGRIEGKTVVIKVADAANDITATGHTFTFDNPSGVSTDVNFYGKTFTAEGMLRKYIITPTVETEDAGSSKNVIITALDYDTTSPSEGMMTANDSQLAMRNAWMVDNDTLMHRMGDLRLPQAEDNTIWAKFNRGMLHSNSSYGRSFGQAYNQLYFGYDKLHAWGPDRVYTGLAVGHLSSNVNYENGSGSVKSTMITLYGTWMGTKGHYLDVVAKGGRISSEYSVTDSNNNLVSASYGAPAYSLSAEYGYRKELSNKYFIEPQVQLTLGHISGVNYQQSNGTNIYQSNVNSAVGRIGVIGGRNLGDKGNAYVKASVLHSFGGSGTVIGSYGNDSLAVDTVSGHSTWVELGAGANVRITENSNIYFDVSRTFGGNVTQKWQFNIGSRLKF